MSFEPIRNYRAQPTPGWPCTRRDCETHATSAATALVILVILAALVVIGRLAEDATGQLNVAPIS